MRIRRPGLGRLAALLAASMALSGCVPVLRKRHASSIRTLAIASVYINRDFYDVRTSHQAGTGNVDLKAAARQLGGVLLERAGELAFGDAAEPEKLSLAAHAAKVYHDRLAALDRWNLLSRERLEQNPGYQAFGARAEGKPFWKALLHSFRKDAEESTVTAPGMRFIPIASVAHPVGEIKLRLGSQDPEEQSRQLLAVLCKDLGVDAVALIRLDMGYRTGLLSRLVFLGRAYAVPSVRADLVVVTRDGHLAASTELQDGSRYEAGGASMLRSGRVELNKTAAETYKRAIERSADALRQRIMKELARL